MMCQQRWGGPTAEVPMVRASSWPEPLVFCHPTVVTSGTGLASYLLQAGAKAQAEGVSFHPSPDETGLEAENYLSTFWVITAASATSLGTNWLPEKALNVLEVLNAEILWGHDHVWSKGTCSHHSHLLCSWSVPPEVVGAPSGGGVDKATVVCRILSNIWTLNYTSTSLPLTSELSLITELYILLILFETHSHWQLSFIVTVNEKVSIIMLFILMILSAQWR